VKKNQKKNVQRDLINNVLKGQCEMEMPNFQFSQEMKMKRCSKPDMTNFKLAA